MSSSIGFTGSGFSVESVSYEALATIRVRFTNDPRLVNPTLTNDGLNPANYALTGPAPMTVMGVAAVSGDPQAVDLFLPGLLAEGQWTLAVATTVVSVDADPLTSPASMSFFVDVAPPQETVNPGAQGVSAADILRKNLNPALVGDNWDALIAAWAVGDDWIEETAEAAFDQLFKITATGQYLTRHAADDGLQRPSGIGIPDDTFRFYAIKHATGQLTENSILDILSVFYGDDSLRAYATSIPGPFNITDGMDLDVLMDESLAVTIYFSNADFAIPAQATATEIGAAITRAFEVAGSNAYAIAVTDPTTGLSQVRIYSAALGLGSSVRVTGGQAQNVFQFPTLLPIYGLSPGTVQWNITVDSSRNITRYTLVNTTLIPDLSQLLVGDYVNIYGSEFTTTGSFPITAVSYQYDPVSGNPIAYFEIAGQYTAQTVTETAPGFDMIFYRPDRQTIHGTGNRAVIVAVPGNELDIQLPATSQAIGRSEYIAAYGQVQPVYSISSIGKTGGTVTVVTSEPTGVSVGSQVIIDSVIANISIPPTYTGTYNPQATNTADHSISSLVSGTGGPYNSNYGDIGGWAVALPNGDVVHGGGRAGGPGMYTWHINSIATSGGVTTLTYTDVNSPSTPAFPHPQEYNGVGVGTNPLWYDGNVIITGGADASSQATSGAVNNVTTQLVVDPTTGYITQNTLSATLVAARAGHCQLTMVQPGTSLDGGFLVMGGTGTTPNTAINSTERYSRAETGGTWATKNGMNNARCQAQAVTLTDGRIMVIGGRALSQGHIVESTTVALYHMDDSGTTLADSSANGLTLTLSGTYTTRTAAEVGYGVYFSPSGTAGRAKRPGNDAVLDTLFKSNAWTIEGFFGDPTQTNISTVISYGGGTTAFFEMQFQKSYTTNSTTFNFNYPTGVGTYATATYTTTTTHRFTHFAVSLATTGLLSLYYDGTLVYSTNIGAGGLSLGTSGANTLYLGYGPSIYGGTVGTLDDVRFSSGTRTAQQVSDDYITACGELYYNTNTFDRLGRLLSSCEIYDPAANTWTKTGPMALSRFGHKAFTLADGRVIVIGGSGYNPTQPSSTPIALSDAEVWSPVTNSWLPAGKSAYPRDFVMAAYDSTRNQISVTGGSDPVGSRVVELFDTQKFKWTSSPARLANAHGVLGAATALNNYGMMVMVGGQDPVTKQAFYQNGGNDYKYALQVYIPGANTFMGTGFNDSHTVQSVLSPTSFTTVANDTQYGLGIGGTVTPVAALPSTIPGPYVWDPNDGVAVTSTTATLTMNIAANHNYGFLTVDDASQFPDEEGYLVLAFGYGNQVAPVKYYNRISDTQLSIDYGYKFPQTIASGATVTLLHNKGAYDPESPETMGSFYITDSPAGRIVAEDAVKAAAGAGINVNVTVVYPGDRGLGGEGLPTSGNYKLSDVVGIFGSSTPDADTVAAREDDE